MKTLHLSSIGYNWMMPKYSIVVPFHNEQDSVTDLYDRLKVVMEHLGESFEMIFIDDIPLYGEGLHRFIPALASWYGAKICEVPIVNIERPDGKSHYGISRTIRVFFDLITIRFLLKYMMRPLHFFGGIGMGGIGTGLLIALYMAVEKTFRNVNVMDAHGPLMVFGAVMLVAGVQMLALGLLGELQVRHFHEPRSGQPYRVAKVLRTETGEQRREICG